jgi:ubiquitin-protein ligase
MRKPFDHWICNNTVVKPTGRVVAQWIENAWGKMSLPTILNSWQKSMEVGTIPLEVVNTNNNNNEEDPLQTPIDTCGDTDAYVLSQETIKD